MIISIIVINTFTIYRGALFSVSPNPTKTFVMLLGRSNPHYPYYMGGIQLEHKDLGILMDSDLNFHSHSCNVTNKASQTLGIIKKTFTG